MIDVLWLVCSILLTAGLWAAYLWDLHVQNERCRARNNQTLRKFSMRLPDRAKLDLS